jgi:hypothetical protein
MPKNRFPDSPEKRELRRRDGRIISRFRSSYAGAGLHYCGMPSVEYLDILEWQDNIREVTAVEYDGETLSDMRIQWSRLGLDSKIECNWLQGDILDVLTSSSRAFDLYNLDFYAGFVYRSKDGNARCTEAVKSLITTQAKAEKSFILITTFNVRDKGLLDYLGLVNDIPDKLVGYENVRECLSAHKAKGHAGLIKLCFLYFCWDIGRTSNFTVKFEKPFIYKSSANMIHFCAQMEYKSAALPSFFSVGDFAELASLPIMRLDGVVPRVLLKAPAITATASHESSS